MFDLSLTIKGDTEEDLWLAMFEILKLISDGFTSGSGSNESDSYSFTVASNFCSIPPSPAIPEV